MRLSLSLHINGTCSFYRELFSTKWCWVMTSMWSHWRRGREIKTTQKGHQQKIWTKFDPPHVSKSSIFMVRLKWLRKREIVGCFIWHALGLSWVVSKLWHLEITTRLLGKKRLSPTRSTVPCGHTHPDIGSLQVEWATSEPRCWPGWSRLEHVRRQERGE